MSKPERPTGGTDAEYGYVTVHDWESQATISDTLMDLLQEVQEVSLEDDELLFEVIDLDAIDELFHATSNESQSLTFEFQACTVLIDGDGRIVVHPPLSAPSSDR